MPEAGISKRRRIGIAARGGRLVLAAVVLGAFAGAILSLTIQVSRHLNSLNVARSDNVQWTLSQLEVDYLLLQMALREAEDDSAASLAQVRRRFDLFYSRLATIDKGTAYTPLKSEFSFSQDLQPVQQFLEDTLPLIDGPDAALRSELSALETTVSGMRENVRGLALQGLTQFAKYTDERRKDVADTLVSLAWIITALVVLLLALAAGLNRMNRSVARSAAEQKTLAARMRAIVGSSLDAVVVIDERGIVQEFNGAAERVFGYTRPEALGRPMVDLIVPKQYAAAHKAGMNRLLETGERRVVGSGRIELEAQRKSGEIFPVEVSIEMTESEEGKSFVSFLRDITAEKRAERELVETRDKALAGEKAKADFLAMMSHEMRTPLNGLLGTMTLLRETDLTDRQATYLNNMDASGHLLLHHVNSVLDISKFEAGRLEVSSVAFDLGALLEEVIAGQSSVATTNSNTLRCVWLSPKPGHVRGDPVRLRQILLNLVNNALKFTYSGEVRLEVEAHGEGRQVTCEFRVMDTGIGITEADQARIFDDFETVDTSYGRKTGGTGLGLGIARRLTKAMGGEIGVESIEGEGSLFWVRIPFEVVAKTEPLNAEQVQSPREQPLSILIVEDNEINRSVLHGMLTLDGHTVAEAADGNEGVAIAGTRAFDAILMDVSMPVMDGIAATRAIRAGGGPCRDVPIIAVTAHAMSADRERFQAAGMSGLVTKPIERDKLRRQLALVDTRLAPVALLSHANAPASHHDNVVDLDALVKTLGEKKVQTLLAAFVREMDDMARAISSDDFEALPMEDLIAEVHRLAGSCGCFGAKSLHEMLHRAETLTKTGDDVGARSAMLQFKNRWEAERPSFSRLLTGAEENAGAAQ
ncbi:hybrid sensor histidine kinase/response regulator [Tropicimonas isoalkanivorans]|uniref:histidine kinase n=1 Tax=Tropicimonas isoalkanivorans TaxID=441112 RepID=A0A1I1GDQ5_9RHOB|nr:PAS domain-containing hybrid sensor histidine kinase/response regulator [Tropicimonas isoalkanivorans]SFC09711.1 PAS domain S-box-containing protein [Tropicimonas isoalkanivorans]